MFRTIKNYIDKSIAYNNKKIMILAFVQIKYLIVIFQILLTGIKEVNFFLQYFICVAHTRLVTQCTRLGTRKLPRYIIYIYALLHAMDHLITFVLAREKMKMV